MASEAASSERGLDFLVIGAQRAGTTALYEYLRGHPELYLPPGKELPFFSHDRVYRQGWERYTRFFSRAPPDSLVGTVTTQYMAGALMDRVEPPPADEDLATEIPRRIVAAFPRVRLIAVLRDPVERAVSQHRLAVMRGWERRTFGEAISTLSTEPQLSEARRRPGETNSYIVFGEYDRILAGYLRHFPREQLCVISSHDLATHPELTLGKVFEFLEVDSSFHPRNAHRRYNQSEDRRRMGWLNPWRWQLSLSGNRIARGVWHRLPSGVRHAIDEPYREAAWRVFLWNRASGGTSRRTAPDDVVRRLEAHFGPGMARLSDLIGPVSGLRSTD